MIEEERLGPKYRNDAKIAEKRGAISREEAKLWAAHREFQSKRNQTAKDNSQKFTNVFQNGKELKKAAMEHNRKYPKQPIPLFSDAEIAFTRWYVSIFGDNWRLISNVLGYHPFTRGSLRSKEAVALQFIHCVKGATGSGHLLNESTPIRPWRSSGQSVLITERPPSLYCSIKQINQMHHTCIKNLNLKHKNVKQQRVYELYEDDKGVLQLRFKEVRKVKEQ